MITVIGSLNIDLLVSISKMVNIGETILCHDFSTAYGGKGGNQAVAASKLGGKVQFIGAIGNDEYGKQYIDHLQHYNIDTTYINILNNESTGMAVVTLVNNDNSIVVIPNANLKLNKQYIENLEEVIAKSQMIVMQFEVNNEVIESTLNIAQKYNIDVILNPAPFRKFPLHWLDKITYLTPNETEYNDLVTQYDISKYKHKVIITKGSKGISYYNQNRQMSIDVPQVVVKDTTGAGDTFNGALATFLVNGDNLTVALQKAVISASLSTQQKGAQTGMPTKEQLKQFLKK